ncbi:MAG: SRPBCC domain-containing protein [Candidatus Pacebacteria bacterium]|nr:SRPBCC domain-containing protein [Candidatus Paceibacterota bacterium]
MQKLHFSIHINASKEKVWNTMLEDATYRQWTAPFNPAGSYYEGSWDEGAEMRFLGPSQDGSTIGGMISRIKENRLHEFLSIEHLGMIENGVIDTASEKVKAWTPAFENYTFTEKDGGTELTIDADSNEEYAEMFSDMWPKALEILKGLAEK